MKPEALQSYFLSASAGSGKTYALSLRYCALVMAHIPPDSICALTFTRAATREIFGAIIRRLVEGNAETFPGSLSRDDALKAILDTLPRLQISTIDAFSAKIARLFAYDLGLNPDLALYEEGASVEAQEILREVVRRALRVTPKRSADELFTRFNIDARGTSGLGRSVTARLQSFLAEYQQLLQTHTKGWGELPEDSDAPTLCDDRVGKIEALRGYLESCPGAAKLTDGTMKRYAQLLDEYAPEVESLRQLHRLWGGKWKHAGDFQKLAEQGTFKSTGKTAVELDATGQALAKALWDDLLKRDLMQTAEHTQALYQALKTLDELTQSYLNETGQIGFTALTKKLAEKVGGHALSMMDPDLLYVAYRMDTAIRHLMIDEFQDTGVEQWQILSSIAHELAGNNGDRSFFYVGDKKQSIYGWRGGDATLFGDTTRLPDIAKGKDLRTSYRSSPAVIDFINRAMTFDELLCAEPWQEPVLKEWREGWKDHIAHRSDAGYSAFVKLFGAQAVWLPTIADAIAARWETVKHRAVSIAVLVPSKKLILGEDGSHGLLDLLRARGVPCAIDGKNRIAETPLGRLVAQLLHWLSDPRATLWCEVAKRIGLATNISEKTPNAWMRLILEEGFVAWLDRCFGAESPVGQTLKPFDREVLGAIRQGLEGLDARGEKDPLSAQRAIESLEVPCSSNSNVVTLMTIHHSKGLTFDLVFTILNDAFINEAGATYETGDDWVLEKPVLNEQYDRHKALNDARLRRKSARFQDNLCALYVAITRASREQIVFAPERACKSSGYRAGLILPNLSPEGATPAEPPSRYLDLEGTAILFEEGTDTWWSGKDVKERTAFSAAKPLPPWRADLSETSIEVEQPSEDSRSTSVADLLRPDARRGANYGTSLHEVYEQIAWTETPPRGRFKEVFRKPGEPCELWREHAFSVALQRGDTRRYLVGQFDRVHLFPESRRAVIYDFKSTQTPGRTEAYDRQLCDYRMALAQLTGFPPENIRAFLLFTHDGSIEEVPYA